jgi:hypothetical protein
MLQGYTSHRSSFTLRVPVMINCVALLQHAGSPVTGSGHCFCSHRRGACSAAQAYGRETAQG